MPTVAWISIAPVKALGLLELEEARLERHGIDGNRRFFLVDADGRMVNGKDCGALVQVRPHYDSAADTLSLSFPDGGVVEGAVELGEPISVRFYSRDVDGRIVVGPWAERLSEYAGQELRLVQADRPGDGVDRARGPVSLLSTASLEALGRIAGADDPVDGRRFRMTIGIDGVAAHEEDEWLGRRVQIGDAVVLPRGHVGRCAVTTQNPDTGVPDLRTLHALRAYRRDGTEPLPFGVYGEVVQAGTVRLGDVVDPGPR